MLFNASKLKTIRKINSSTLIATAEFSTLYHYTLSTQDRNPILLYSLLYKR